MILSSDGHTFLTQRPQDFNAGEICMNIKKSCAHHCLNAVQSSDSHSEPSCIEILWYSGKNYMSNGANHCTKMQCANCCSHMNWQSFMDGISIKWIFVGSWQWLFHNQIHNPLILTGKSTAAKLWICRSENYFSKQAVTPFPLVCVWVMVLGVSMENHMLWFLGNTIEVHCVVNVWQTCPVHFSTSKQCSL